LIEKQERPAQSHTHCHIAQKPTTRPKPGKECAFPTHGTQQDKAAKMKNNTKK